MQHFRIAVYKVRAGSQDEIARRAKDGMLPTFQAQPGFVQYSLVQAGDDRMVSITTWQTTAQAEQALSTAAAWVRDNLAQYVIAVENYTGELKVASWLPAGARS